MLPSIAEELAISNACIVVASCLLSRVIWVKMVDVDFSTIFPRFVLVRFLAPPSLW